MAAGGAGLGGWEFWTPDAAGPLATVVPLPPVQLTALGLAAVVPDADLEPLGPARPLPFE